MSNQPPLNLENFPGLRLYVEDPQVAIRRQIRRTAIISLAVIVVGLVLIFIASSLIKKASLNLAEKEKLINTSISSQAIDANTEKIIQEMAPFLSEIKEALPKSTDLLSFQGALSQAASAAGVQISVTFANQSKTSSAKDQAFQAVPFQIDIKGPTQNIINFLSVVEKMPYYVKMVSFKISASADKDSSADLSMEIFTQKSENTPQNLPEASPK